MGSGFLKFGVHGERVEFVEEVFVSAEDHVGVVDHGASVREGGGYDHCHAGADVRAGHLAAVKRGRAGDHHAVRVADDGVRAHGDQAVDEVDAAFEHLLEEETGAARLGGGDDHAAHHVAGELRPGAVGDGRDGAAEVVLHAEVLVRLQDDVVAVEPELDVEFLVDALRHPVVRGGELAGDLEAAACCRRHREEAGGFDVVGVEGEFRAVQLGDALNEERIGVEAGDLRAHEVQELGELLHVGLRGGVADDRLALREDGGDQDVLGGGHAGLVEEDVRAGEPVFFELEMHHGGLLVERLADAELLQTVEMRIQTAATDEIAPGQTDEGFPAAGRHGAAEDEGGAERGAFFRGQGGGVDVAGADDDRGAFARDGCAEVAREVEHDLDVEDLRHVVDDDFVPREDGGGDDGERGVFVAAGRDDAGDARGAFDNNAFHDL